MLTCPQCRKTWPEPVRQCGTCQADLSLLADFQIGIGSGLEGADALTKAGELGKALQAYLAVREIDPTNPTARDCVGQWATAVRFLRRKRHKRRQSKTDSPPAPLPVSEPAPPAPAVPLSPLAPVRLSLWLFVLIGLVLFLAGLGAGFIYGAGWTASILSKA